MVLADTVLYLVREALIWCIYVQTVLTTLKFKVTVLGKHLDQFDCLVDYI